MNNTNKFVFDTDSLLTKKEQQELSSLKAKQMSKTVWLTQQEFDRIKQLNEKQYSNRNKTYDANK